MRLSSFLVAVILFSTIIISSSMIMTDLGDSYNVTVDSNYSSTYNKMNDINELSQDLGSTVEQTEPNVFDIGISFFKGAWEILRMIFKSTSITTSLIGNFAADYGINPIFANIAATLLTIIIVTVIIGLVLKRDV